MEEAYLFEIWYSNQNTDVVGNKKDVYNRYILSTEYTINEDAGKYINKGYNIITINKLCKEEAIMGGLWKESVVSRLCDKIETLLLEYRCYNDKVGRPLVDMLSNGELDSESGKAEIHTLTDYLFEEILKEWKKCK